MSTKASGGKKLDLPLLELDPPESSYGGLETVELPFEFGWRQFEIESNKPQVMLNSEILDDYDLENAWADTQQ